MFTFYINKQGDLTGNAPDNSTALSCVCDMITGVCTGHCGCATSPLGVGCYSELEQNNWKMTY